MMPLASYPPAVLAGTDNRVINGDFRIDQPNNFGSVTPTASANITDTFGVTIAQSSKFSMQQTSTAVANMGRSLVFTSLSAYAVGAAENFYSFHKIEAHDCSDLGFGTASAQNIMVQFLAKASIAGNYCFTLFNASLNRFYNSVYTLTANTVTPVTLSIPGDTSGSWNNTGNTVGIGMAWDLGTGANAQAASPNVWNTSSLSVAGCVQLVANNGATLRIANVRLYPGNSPVPYAMPSYAQELPKVQRRYRMSFPIGTAPAQNAGIAGAVSIKNPIALGDPAGWVPFDPPMLGNPTIATYNTSATNANWRDITAAADVTVSVDPGGTKERTGVLLATSGTVATLGDILAIHYTADARLT